MKKDFPYDVINYKFYSLESINDFIQLLNEIKHKFFSKSFETDVEQTEDLKPITINRIKFYLSNLKKDWDETKLYHISEIPKKTGGNRVIHAPVSDLKVVLKYIDILLRSVYIPHPNAFAFIEHKNIVDNAKMHTNKRFVYNIDIKDFFYSFDYNRVKTALYKEPFNLNTSKEKEEIAYWISILTTYKINGKQVLPQGSPASPVLTNIICRRLDEKLYRLAQEFSVNYSRYADDITFSSDLQIFHGKFIRKLNRIIESEGLVTNKSKIRLQNQGERQVVTGITVNKGTNVSREYIKELRMYLYYIEQYGIQKAVGYFLKDKKRQLSDTRSYLNILDESNFQKTLKGKLNFLAMVRGKDDPVYSKLSNRYNLLFPNQRTSVIESIVIYCQLGSINLARQQYTNWKKHKNHKILSSFSVNDLEFDELVDLNNQLTNPENEKKKTLIENLNQLQKIDKKEPSELQLNINFLEQILAEDNIGVYQRHIILNAFSEYVKKSNIGTLTTDERSIVDHNPKAVQKFLIQFTLENAPVKFLTHPIDIPFNSFQGLMEGVNNKQYYKYWSELQDLDNELYWNVIHPFIFRKKNKDGNVRDFSWGTYGIKLGWQYPENIEMWCAENFDNQADGSKKMPGEMRIPKEFLPRDKSNKLIKPNGKSLKFFEDFIGLFNSEIRFIDSELKDLLLKLSEELLPQHDVDLRKVSDILPKFYVSVSKVRKALKFIFKMIDDRPTNRNVEILVITIENKIELKIIHLNSIPSKFNDLINAGSKGSIASIVKELKHVCDFSIITGYVDSDEIERFDYLYSEMKDSTVKITKEDSNSGFTFILTFLLPGNE
jgi:RNA-directed DNA polymerase